MNIKSLICALATLTLTAVAARADWVPTGNIKFGPLQIIKGVPGKPVKLEATLYYEVKDSQKPHIKDMIAFPNQLVDFTVNWKSDRNGRDTAVGNQKTTDIAGYCATSPKVPKGEKAYIGKSVRYSAHFSGATLTLPNGRKMEFEKKTARGTMNLRNR